MKYQIFIKNYNLLVFVPAMFSVIYNYCYIVFFSKPITNELLNFFNNLSISVIAASIFYWVQVYIPEQKKKTIIKNNFNQYWLRSKKDIISILLCCLYGSYSLDLVEKLTDVKEFQKFFNEKHDIKEGQTKWDGVLNGLDQVHLDDIIMEFELLVNEIDFLMNNIVIHNEDFYAFLKRLKTGLYKMKTIRLDFGEEKILSRYIWEVFGGYDNLYGKHKDYDIVKFYIDKL